MRTILIITLMAAIWTVSATQEDWDNYGPRNLFLASPVSGHWATIAHCIGPSRGYEPQCTVVYSSWLPIVREVAPNRWQVTFVRPQQN